MLVLALLIACKNGDSDTDTLDTDVVDSDTDVATDDIQLISDDDAAAIRAVAEDDMRTAQASGAQIAVWLDGQIVFQAQIGSKSPDDDLPFDHDTMFQIGSDTKKYTAMALLQQESAGTLSRADSVADAIPGFTLAVSPTWASQATLDDLISHQGGLYDYTPWDDAPADTELQTRLNGAFAANEWAFAPGGAMWNYSNPNFSVAGAAVEIAADRPWADVIEDDIFAPLGMTRSVARESSVDDNYALSDGYVAFDTDEFDWLGDYTFAEGTATKAEVVDNAFIRPAGLVWSTATDQANFGGFLIDGNTAVLADSQRSALTTEHARIYPTYPGYGYGYGLFVVEGMTIGEDYYATPVWSHGGNTLTFTSTTYMLPEQRLSISILSNSYGDDFTPTVVEIISRLAELPAPSTRPDVPTAETDHSLLVGTYADAYLGDLIVTDEDGQLKIEAPHLQELTIPVATNITYANVTDIYTVRIAGATYEFTFVADDDGDYTWVRDRQFVGTRVPLTADHRPSRGGTREEVLFRLAAEQRMSSLVFPH